MEFAASGGGGGGAPINASYLVLGADGILTSERVFTPGATLAAVDGGAGGPYTVNIALAGTAGTYAYPASLTTDAYGRVTALTAGSAPITAHTGLSALGWTGSGHTGASTSVATFDGGGAAQNVAATADGQVLTRVGGVLVFAAIAASAGVIVDSTKTLEIIYLAPLEAPLPPGLNSAVGPGVFA